MHAITTTLEQKVANHRSQFLHYLFSSLRPYQYVVLKTLEANLDDWPVHSDVDILCDQEAYQQFLVFLKRSPEVVNFHARKSTHDHKYFIYFKDQSFLQVDILFHLVRKEVQYLDNSQIFERQITSSEGIKYASRSCVMEHVFLFNVLNHSGIPEKYLKQFETYPAFQQKEFLRLLYQRYQIIVPKLKELGSYRAHMEAQVRAYLNDLPENNWFNRTKRRINLLTDHFRGSVRGKGKIISFSGVDGAGKSTILAHVKELVESKYRQPVVVLRHRPSILPILSSIKYGKAEAEERSATTLPRQGTNQNPISSLIRFTYYLMDYLLGRWYIQWKYLNRGVTVLFDRYYFDFIIDGRRSNIKLPANLVKFFWPMVQKPNLNFFLYADAEVILARKQELNKEDIESLTTSYLDLFQSLQNPGAQPEFIPINNIDLTETEDFIEKHYVSNCKE